MTSSKFCDCLEEPCPSHAYRIRISIAVPPTTHRLTLSVGRSGTAAIVIPIQNRALIVALFLINIVFAKCPDLVSIKRVSLES